ncbi:epimerase [Actinomadura cremea]|nr:epimerase [Actinomadura cremea]
MTVVGVLGGAGAVGRAAAGRLADLGDLRIGGRNPGRAADLGVPVRVDLHDPASLAAFCAGCDVVLNCAGPSYRVLDAVARAALAAGAHYVDAAGDLPAMSALGPVRDRAAVFSAGLTPGLSGLLPRLLADRPLRRLDVHVGGAAALGEMGARDMLASRGPEFGTPLAAWRDGRAVPGALRPLHRVALPGFAGRVHAYPFLSTEAARLAGRCEVDELRAHTVYVSENVPRALAAAWADGGPVDRHVPALLAAAEADLAGTRPYSTLLFQAAPRASGPPRRLTLRTSDPNALSGAVAALAVRDVLAGRVPPGAHLAAERLHPAAVLDRLRTDPVVTGAELQ